jgi:hypothetical protein
MRARFEDFKAANQVVDYIITVSGSLAVFAANEPGNIGGDYIDGLGLWVFVTFRSPDLGFVLVGQGLDALSRYLAVYADPQADRRKVLAFLREMGFPPDAPSNDAITGERLS